MTQVTKSPPTTKLRGIDIPEGPNIPKVLNFYSHERYYSAPFHVSTGLCMVAGDRLLYLIDENMCKARNWSLGESPGPIPVIACVCVCVCVCVCIVKLGYGGAATTY